MKRTLVLAMSMALVACGGGVNSKEDAAKVVQRLGAIGAGSTSTVQSGLTSSKLFNVSVTGKSGTATASIDLDMDMDISLTSVAFNYTVDLTFKDFSPDGDNYYSGTEKVVFSLNAASSENKATGIVAMIIKANVETKGDYNSKLTADLTMTLDASVIKATSGKVSMTLNGTVTADGTTYAYDHEQLEVSAE